MVYSGKDLFSCRLRNSVGHILIFQFPISLTLKYNTEMHLVAPMNKFNIPLQTQLVISRVDEGDERGDPRTEKGLPTGFVRVKGFEELIM